MEEEALLSPFSASMWVFCLLLLFVTSNEAREEKELVLVPHGMPVDYAGRVVLKMGDGGRMGALPCVLADSGVHAHGDAFTRGNFHYLCKNGTAEVIACIGDDSSVIQLGRTFQREGVRHKCIEQGESVSYERERLCVQNGVSYEIGESFRNGSFRVKCGESGLSVEGCYMRELNTLLVVGESRVLNNRRHECELQDGGRVRYSVRAIGCTRNEMVIPVGDIFTDEHIRYQCSEDGALRVLGCTDEGGLFLELGRDVFMNGLVHRCYRIDTTTFYQRFHCEEGSLAACLASSKARPTRASRLSFR